MTTPSSQAVLSALALILLGGLSFALVFHDVPSDSRELISVIVGALSGALTMTGSTKLADRIGNTTAGDTTIQPVTTGQS